MNKDISNFFVKRKKLIIEAVVVVAILAGGYYFYINFSEKSATTTVTVNEQLLGQNFVVLLKAINQDNISFAQKSFLDSPLVKQLQDFSETILPNDSRGRSDPFTAYASSRPIR